MTLRGHDSGSHLGPGAIDERYVIKADAVKPLPADPEARLVWLKRQFLNRYTHQWDIQPDTVGYAGMEMWKATQPTAAEIATYDHRTVCGDGLTAEGAVDDWYARLPKDGGYAIIWRAKPELVAEKDFDSKITKWRVFSRFCVLPTEPKAISH